MEAKLAEALFGQINPVLLIALMALGFLIKYSPQLQKISNGLIPLILLAMAVIVEFVMSGTYTVNGFVSALVTGLINAAIAVWFHESGKNLFELLNKNNFG